MTGARARAVRTNLRFAAGLAGICYETIVDHSDRPVLLAVFAAMIGLDAFSTLLPESMSGGRRRFDPPAEV